MVSAAEQRRFYHRRKALGICVSCEKPATNGIYCAFHHGYRRRHKSTVNELHQARRKARGVCAYCNRPRLKRGAMCQWHQAKSAAKYRGNFLAKAWFWFHR